MKTSLRLTLAVLMMLVMPASANGAAEEPQTAAHPDTVVILHGIGHTKWNMFWVERALKKAGYQTVNITYPSRERNIDDNAVFIRDRLITAGVWERPGEVHFVSHSMGGLVGRRYLAIYRAELSSDKLGRFVMIAPPNGGSEVADLLKDFPPYTWIYGPAGQELTTAMQGDNDDEPYYELGIIAGTTEWPYFVAAFVIPGKSDGRVSIENTRLAGMTDHITLPATHSFISWKENVHHQVIEFLEHGEFSYER